MRSSMTRFAAGLTFIFLSACASTPANNPAHTHYAATQHIVLADILGPPPIAGSPADQQDLQQILTTQKNSTIAEKKLAQLDAELTPARFQSVLGPRFDLNKLPVTAAFLQKVSEDEGPVIAAAKEHFNRPRPYAISSLVKPLVKRPNSAAYPSGHSCYGYLNAILLARMVPEKAPQIFARGREFAHNRIVAGVHYPTDVEAGIISASVIADQLLQDEKFLADFNAARQEMRQALGLQ